MKPFIYYHMLHTVCFTDLGKLKLLMVVRFFATASAALKNGARFKSGQKLLKNNRLAT
jgi:hypothetical protein